MPILFYLTILHQSRIEGVCQSAKWSLTHAHTHVLTQYVQTSKHSQITLVHQSTLQGSLTFLILCLYVLLLALSVSQLLSQSISQAGRHGGKQSISQLVSQSCTSEDDSSFIHQRTVSKHSFCYHLLLWFVYISLILFSQAVRQRVLPKNKTIPFIHPSTNSLKTLIIFIFYLAIWVITVAVFLFVLIICHSFSQSVSR